MRPLAALLLPALLALLPVVAQDAETADGGPTFSLDVNVVNVLATVRDRGGRLLSTLTKDDFILSEDGVRQEIRYFSHQTDLPLTIGLLLEDMTLANGALGFIPESHAGELFDQYDEQGQWKGCLNDRDVERLDVTRADYIEAAAGAITVHNCRTVHGSKKNLSPKGRPLLLNIYTAADAFPYTANPLNSPQYSGVIVRGKEARWAYHDPRPCLIPPDWSGGYTSLYALQQEEEWEV